MHGNWKSVFNLSAIQGEDLTLYNGNNNGFVAVAKFSRLSGIPYSIKLHIYTHGRYHIKRGKLHYVFEELKVIYNHGFPQQYLDIMMAETINAGPSEIISFNKNEIVTKNVKSGITMSSKKTSIDANFEDIEKFIEDDNS